MSKIRSCLKNSFSVLNFTVCISLVRHYITLHYYCTYGSENNYELIIKFKREMFYQLKKIF
jgi:hypothetical protein